jgi:hypothetical protein
MIVIKKGIENWRIGAFGGLPGSNGGTAKSRPARTALRGVAEYVPPWGVQFIDLLLYQEPGQNLLSYPGNRPRPVKNKDFYNNYLFDWSAQ